jgi:PAS domain S-box-containing protein
VPSASNFFDPARLIIVCAITLTLVVLGSAGLIVSSLHNRAIAESERALSNSSLIVAKQFEQTFTAVEAVQKGFYEDLSRLHLLNERSIATELGRHDVHLKLRDKVGGMPYVGSLAIINTQGRLINFSRQWPIPDISLAHEDYVKALRADTTATSFLGSAVPDHTTGAWVTHFARKISGTNGEFLGIISATLDLAYLQSYFREISSDPDSSLALFRDDGVLLARFPENGSDLGRKFANAIAIRLAANADHGVGMTEGVIDGSVRMVAAHRVSGYPLVVSATKTSTAILANWRKTAALLAGAALLIIAVITAFAFLFTRLFRNYQALEQVRAERNRAEQLRQQSQRFDVALNNMSQGLVMFDASSKLVVSNTRFLEIYGLSPDVVKPGLSLLDLLKHRKERGSFGGDPDEYYVRLLSQISKRNLTKQNVPTPAGRIIQIVNQPMPDGGWVATHEDITEKIQAENEIKRQEEQLNAALDNISQGVCMFDASRRLIVCNKKYADIYGLTDEQTKPGTPIEAILEHRIASGNAPEDHEAYIRDRLNEVAINQPYQTVCATDVMCRSSISP